MEISRQSRGDRTAKSALDESQATEPGRPNGSASELGKATAHPGDNVAPGSQGGVYFCQVKGATRRNGGDPMGSAGMKLFAVGDRVKLVPAPRNKLDPDALLALRLSGQPIGTISGRQAARFADKLDLLTATVHSWDKDEWNHDVLNLRVEESIAQQAGEVLSPAPKAPAAAASALTARKGLLKAAIGLPLRKVLLGSLLISFVGAALVRQAWWAAGMAIGTVVLIEVLLSSRA